jgi:hypothetical protein
VLYFNPVSDAEARFGQPVSEGWARNTGAASQYFRHKQIPSDLSQQNAKHVNFHLAYSLLPYYGAQSLGATSPENLSAIQRTTAIVLAWAARPWPMSGRIIILTLLPAAHSFFM